MSHTLRSLRVVMARRKRSRQQELGRNKTVLTGAEKWTWLAGLVLWAIVELGGDADGLKD